MYRFIILNGEFPCETEYIYIFRLKKPKPVLQKKESEGQFFPGDVSITGKIANSLFKATCFLILTVAVALKTSVFCFSASKT